MNCCVDVGIVEWHDLWSCHGIPASPKWEKNKSFGIFFRNQLQQPNANVTFFSFSDDNPHKSVVDILYYFPKKCINNRQSYIGKKSEDPRVIDPVFVVIYSIRSFSIGRPLDITPNHTGENVGSSRKNTGGGLADDCEISPLYGIDCACKTFFV